jgi:hypothetical protein
MKVLIALLALSFCAFSVPRVVVTKVIKADTVVTYKMDTLRAVTYDTLKVTSTIRDSVILIKSDTLKWVTSKKETVKKVK